MGSEENHREQRGRWREEKTLRGKNLETMAMMAGQLELAEHGKSCCGVIEKEIE